MNGLSLCSGIGGIELGLKLACPEYRTVCYVEREAYAAAVLVARMADKVLDEAPIWSDIATFDGKPWRGVVDIVAAGFPCQPFSVAGQRRYEADERHIWPHIARIIGECEPAFVFLENVSIRAFVEPWRDLRGLGFALSRPFACTAAELGAGHLRRRIFVLAYRYEQTLSLEQGWGVVGTSRQGEIRTRASAGDGNGERRSQPEWRIEEERRWIGDSAWWDSEPGLERLVSRIPNSVDRHRALGNAVVPAMAAFAFASLWWR